MARILIADDQDMMRDPLAATLAREGHEVVIVSATLAIGNVISLEAGLSYLGIGAREPTPSWGSIFFDGIASESVTLAGIAGSTRIGRYCLIGGRAGILGHLEICDGAIISATAGPPPSRRTNRNPRQFSSATRTRPNFSV